MSSYIYGKAEVCAWVREHFPPPDSTILDVGACDGNWLHRLPEYAKIDAVEAYRPNLRNLTGYRNVFHADIREFEYDRYDLIIFGDVIEHLTVAQAQTVLEYARPRCRDMIVAVPFLFEQGAKDGNPYEIHIQDDLTPDLFSSRYPGFEVLCNPGHMYMYYHKAGGPT